MSYFLNTDEIVQTIRMIEQEHLDVRTITLGLSLLDCATGDIKRTADKVYEKICREAHDLVPVGEDQKQHVEFARDIAIRFNKQMGRDVFTVPEPFIQETTDVIPGLDGRKMSKSYGNAINISMTAEETAKRIKKSQTDSERMITFDPENRPGVSGLLSTAAICTGRSEVEIAEEIGMGGSGQLKKYVTEAVNEYFAPIRERRQRYENDLDYVKDVLHEGNRRANEIAEQTLAEVQDAMGMVY